MRILYVSHYALPHLGGIEVVVDSLAREMAARGHEVTHLASSAVRPDDPAPASEELGYRRVLLRAVNLPETRLEVPYPVFGPGLRGAVADAVGRADVVHAHGVLYRSSALALRTARGRHPQVARVVTEHVGHVAYRSRVLDTVQRAALATLGRQTARASQAILVLNGKVLDEMRALAPDVPVRVVHNGVDTDRYSPASAAQRAALRRSLGWDERPRVLFVGRLVEKKGAPLVLAAAAALPEAQFVLVGPGTAPAGAPPNVETPGAMAPDRVRELYRAADVFLLPSRGEGFPVTAQEALASGLPVLLGHDPGYAPYLDGAGDAAAMVEPAPDAVAAAVRRVLAGDLPALRTAAAAHATRAFSWSRAGDAHERLYRELMSAAGR